MKTALLFYDDRRPETRATAVRVRGLLRREGVRVIGEDGRRGEADFAVAVGGDGTMLRAAHAVARRGTPLVGINTGGLGFLSGTEKEEAERDIRQIAAGRFPIQERRMLSVEGFRGKRRLFGPVLALNECAIRPSAHSRAFYLRVSLGDEYLTTYFGDGLIASTPTGSTAYALSAMGPIVEPSLDVLLLTPICPHTLTQRPLILPFDRELRVELIRRRTGEPTPTMASTDGQDTTVLRPGDHVVIRRAEQTFRLMVNPRRGYFDVLRTKLQWGAETRRRRK